MNDASGQGDREARALWQAWHDAAAPDAAATLPGDPDDLMAIAAWLDGERAEGPAVRAEDRLARDPALLDFALAHAAGGPAGAGAGSPAVERLVVRAQALVAPPVTTARRRAGGFAWFGLRVRVLQWAVAGALCVVAAVGGFSLGGDLAGRYAQEDELVLALGSNSVAGQVWAMVDEDR